MKKVIFAVAALAIAFSSGAFAEESVEEQCKRFAQEDGIPAEEMDEYLKVCMADAENADPVFPMEQEMSPEQSSQESADK